MKIASRYLIPLELLMGVLIISWGFAGLHGRGALARSLEAHDLQLVWGLVLCGVGAAQVVAAALEQLLGRRWPDDRLLFSVTLRFVLAGVAAVVWFYICYLLVQIRGVDLIVSLGLQAPAALVFSVWILVANRKVACLLDPRCPTETLQQTMRIERRRLLEH